MKIITIILLSVFISCKAIGQDTLTLEKLPLFTTNSIEFSIMDNYQSYVSMLIDENHDTTYSVGGDSLTAIKGLFKIWNDKEKEIKQYEQLIKWYKNLLEEMIKSAQNYLNEPKPIKKKK